MAQLLRKQEVKKKFGKVEVIIKPDSTNPTIKKPSSNNKATTSTNASATTTKRTSKRRRGCVVTFKNIEDVRVKTMLALKGTDTCALDHPDLQRYALKPSEFTKVGRVLGGYSTPELGKSYTLIPTRLATDTKNTAVEFSNSELPPGSGGMYRHPNLRGIIEKSFSKIFTKFYAGFYSKGKRAEVFMFCLFQDPDGKKKAIAYKTTGGVVGDAEGLLRVLQNNKFLKLKGKKNKFNSIKDYKALGEIDVNTVLNKIDTHINSLKNYKFYLKMFYAKAKRSKESAELKFGKDIVDTSKRSLVYIETYIKFLKDLKQDMSSFFSNPSEQTLEKLNLSANIVGAVQKVVIHGK